MAPRLQRLCSLLFVWPRCASNVLDNASVFEWLSGLGGPQAYPLMDFVTNDFDEINVWVDGLRSTFLRPCMEADPGACPLADRALELAQGLVEREASLDSEQGISLVQWLLQLDWVELAGGGARTAPLLDAIVTLASKSGSPASCDEHDSAEDHAFVRKLLQGLDGLETLPLEKNEIKWADFFGRSRRGSGFCLLGVAALFLVAGDITAYAAGVAGGEHLVRVRRALTFAQGLAREHVQRSTRADAEPLLDLMRTSWPLWRLLWSISEELSRGAAEAHHAPARALIPARWADSTHAAVTPGELYLSVVVQCRNDDYGGNMLMRLNRMLTTTTMMLHAAGLPAEIIIVDWNPPLDEKSIAEVIERAPGTTSTVPIRVIQVPPAVHASFPHHKAHPIFEHTAENVAFRRARGRFVLKTNIDNILSPDVILFMARRQLREDAVYRATYLEYDFGPETEGFPPHRTLSWLFGRPDLLEQAAERGGELQRFYPEDADVCTAPHADERGPIAGPARPFFWAGSGDFVLASRVLILHVRGYPEVAQNWQVDDMIHCRLRAVGARQIVLQPPCVTVHQNHRRINRIRSSTRWVITDSSFESACQSPFRPLPTQIGLGENWGFRDHEFEEVVV